MLFPTSPLLVRSNSSTTSSTFNSIKIDFSQMSLKPSNLGKYTQCKKCGAVLISEDKKTQIQKGNDGYVWSCRFCRSKNITQELYFTQTNSKFTLQKLHHTKLTPPLILFLIDHSGSMSQSIFHSLKRTATSQVAQMKKSINPKIMDALKDSRIYKRQKEQLLELSTCAIDIVALGKMYTNLKQGRDNEEEFSKLAFLYMMIEQNLKLMNQKCKKDGKQSDFRVGFIFFNDYLTVLKAAKQKNIPLYLHSKDIEDEQWPYTNTFLNYDSFQEIYTQGLTYDRYFADSKLGNLDMSRISVDKVKTGGKTALGPALALAMGMLAVHDAGSRVVVATDSLPNYGLLANGDKYDGWNKIGTGLYYYRYSISHTLGKCLKDNRATLSILKWTEMNQEDQQFVQFRKKNQQHVDVIQIDLTKVKSHQALDLSWKSLSNLISRQPLGHPYTITINCDNPKIKPTKFKYQSMDWRALRFINSNSKIWIQLNLKQKLQAQDYLFPVTTQIVVEYDDIFGKERDIFISYVQQRIVKVDDNTLQTHTSLPTQKSLSISSIQHVQGEHMEWLNMDNLQALIDMEAMHKFESMRDLQSGAYFQSIQSSQEVKSVFKHLELQSLDNCENVNDFASRKNKTYGDMASIILESSESSNKIEDLESQFEYL